MVVVGTCPDLGVVTAIPQPLRTVVRQWGLRLAAAQAIATRAAGGTPVPLADLLAREFLAAPDRMFSADRYHPSAAGYELAAQILLPGARRGLGEWGSVRFPTPPAVSESPRTTSGRADAGRLNGPLGADEAGRLDVRPVHAVEVRLRADLRWRNVRSRNLTKLARPT